MRVVKDAEEQCEIVEEAKEASKEAGIEAFGYVSKAEGVKLIEDSIPAADFHLMQQESDDEEGFNEWLKEEVKGCYNTNSEERV